MTTFSHDGATGVTRLPAAPDTAPGAPDSPRNAPDTDPTTPDTTPTAHMMLSVGTGGGKASIRHTIDLFTAAGWSVVASDGKADTDGNGGRSA
ncbi:hypothetical protein ACFZAV_42700 [Streptomyces sp. NPDC008343]|uniref:hypothetical protein n=1 Tax=Streptomyces sp. NPDC008343 TaxID=3364828 RepID=UPI0036E7AE0A